MIFSAGILFFLTFFFLWKKQIMCCCNLIQSKLVFRRWPLAFFIYFFWSGQHLINKNLHRESERKYQIKKKKRNKSRQRYIKLREVVIKSSDRIRSQLCMLLKNVLTFFLLLLLLSAFGPANWNFFFCFYFHVRFMGAIAVAVIIYEFY